MKQQWEERQKINPILNMPKLYRSLMALRLEVDQSIVEHLAGIIGESITEAVSQAKAERTEEIEKEVKESLTIYRNSCTHSKWRKGLCKHDIVNNRIAGIFASLHLKESEKA